MSVYPDNASGPPTVQRVSVNTLDRHPLGGRVLKGRGCPLDLDTDVFVSDILVSPSLKRGGQVRLPVGSVVVDM